MTRSRLWMAALFALVLFFAAACGGEDDDASGATSGDDGVAEADDADDVDDPEEDTSDDADDDADDAGDDGDEAPATGEFGTITINGDSYPVTTLNRCIPFSESDEDLDLQALGDGVKINIYATSGTVDDVSVDGLTVESEYGSRAFGGFDSEIHDQSTDGGRARGSATMPDAMGETGSVEVEWDVEIPDEVRDCSL